MSRTYQSIADLPAILPVFPLPSVILLPGVELPLNIFEPRYLDMIDAALASHRMIGMIQPQQEPSDNNQQPPLYPTGCVGRITSFSELPDNRYSIILTGICRFEANDELSLATRYRSFNVGYDNFSDDLMEDNNKKTINRESLLDAFGDYLKAHNLNVDWGKIETASSQLLVNSLCIMAPFSGAEKQALLEATDLAIRADILVAMTRMALADDSTPHSLQ